MLKNFPSFLSQGEDGVKGQREGEEGRSLFFLHLTMTTVFCCATNTSGLDFLRVHLDGLKILSPCGPLVFQNRPFKHELEWKI